MPEKLFDVIGLGYCGLDYCCLCQRIPIDDKVEAQQTLAQGGGPAATATYAAAKLGAKAAFIGAVGDDERGKSITGQMEQVGIDTSLVAVRGGAESPSAFCWTDSTNGNRSIVWTRGTVEPLRVDEITEGVIASCRLLHLDGHQTAAAIQAARYARKNGITVAIDAGTIVDDIDELLALCDIIIASEKFMHTYLNARTPEQALRLLFHKTCKFAAVTLGDKGSYGFDGEKVYHQPSFEVRVVDTTGAGDVFHGAFVYKYVNGGDWQDCLNFSAAVAAMKCTEFGGRTGIPTLAELELFFVENDKLWIS